MPPAPEPETSGVGTAESSVTQTLTTEAAPRASVESAPSTRASRHASTRQYRIPVDEPVDKRVTVAELLVFAAICVIGLVALVSLASAHLGHFSGPVVLVGSLVLILACAVPVLLTDRPSLRLDPVGLIPVVLGSAFAAFMMFPGFQYATSDRDPGVYVGHAAAIARGGSITFPDDLLAAHLPALQAPGAAWPGIWTEPGHPGSIFPQFYHLWPALLASAKTAGGWTGLFDTAPLLGVLAVAATVCIGRRLAGWPGAWAAAALLSTNMLEVWQAKYPSSEIFGQMLFAGATMAMVITIQAGWRTAAVAAGVLLGLSYLERPDAILLVVAGWVVVCALFAARRLDSRGWLFAAGLLVLLPYGFYQAYSLASQYSQAAGIPSLAKIVGGMVLLALIAAVLGRQRTIVVRVVTWGSSRRVQFGLASALVLVCGILALIGGLRPRLFGADYFDYNGTWTRSYDELSLIRLSWFFSLTGLVLVGAGVVFLAYRRWRLDAWLIALPAIGLLTLYCYHLRNSPYMMWATRRFVPTVIVGLILLIGCGVALIVVVLRRYLPEVVAAVVAAAVVVGLTVFFLHQSNPLRHHDENGGSVEVVGQIAAVAGDQRGIFLWQHSTYCCAAPWQLFGSAMITIGGESSALLPTADSVQASVLTTYTAYAKKTGRPLFYIGDQKAIPPALPGYTVTVVKQLAGSLPHWEETYVSRPKKTHNYVYSFTIFRLQPV